MQKYSSSGGRGRADVERTAKGYAHRVTHMLREASRETDSIENPNFSSAS